MDITQSGSYDPKQIEAEIQAVSHNITEYQEVLSCEILKTTIIVVGRNGRKAVNKVFSFPPGSIPSEIKAFFEAVANRLCIEKLMLEDSIVLLKVGNKVVELSEFIKQYFSIPLSENDLINIEAIKQLQSQQTLQVNGIGWTINVSRIS